MKNSDNSRRAKAGSRGSQLKLAKGKGGESEAEGRSELVGENVVFPQSKYAFLDRDGALIYEPQDTFQVDRMDILKILPGVIVGLQEIKKSGYKLVMVTNQDGLGTESFPWENFEGPHNEMLRQFGEAAVHFDEIFICPHFKSNKCSCRKPKIGLVEKLLASGDVDKKSSFMYGDRDTDRQFAENIGVRFIKAQTNEPFNINLKKL